MSHTAKQNVLRAFEEAGDNAFAKEAIHRFLEEDPAAEPLEDHPQILGTSTPAGLRLLSPPFQAVVWDTGFAANDNDDETLDAYADVIRVLLRLKHGERYSINTQTNSFLSSSPFWTFHDHGGDTPELMHLTLKGPGLAWASGLNEETKRDLLLYGRVSDDVKIGQAQPGQLVNFDFSLVHSGPKAEDDGGARKFALGHVTPGF